ncbi:MAG: prealbumin-like fold domain-containing protein [Candidatus Saliniplasma sp.]
MKAKIVIVLIAVLIASALISAFGSSQASAEPELRSESSPGLTAEDEVKNKTFYMYKEEDAVDVGYRTTKEMYNTTYPVGSGNRTALSSFRVLVDWHLYPTLAGDLQLDGDSTLTVWARSPTGGGVDMTYRLTEVDPDGSEDIVAENTVATTVQTDWSTHDIPVNIDNYTASEGSTLMVTFDLWGDAAREYEIAYGGTVDGGMRDTNVTLPCMDHIDVSDVYTTDSEGNVNNLFSPDAEDKNITIYANVTNPFGGYDVRWVNTTLTGPEGVILENISMQKIEGYFDSYKSSYNYSWDYTGEPEGTYDITVRAVDKNGMRALNTTGTFDDHEEYGHHSFVIGGLDHYVNLKIVDDHEEILPNVTVNLKVSDEVIFATDETDEDGIVNFTVANATYLVTVMWQDMEVSTNRTLEMDVVGDRPREDPYDLKASIFYPSFTVVDMEGEEVGDANIYMTHPNGTTRSQPYVTDDQGQFSLQQTAGGIYNLDVEWKGRDVGDFDIDISSSGERTLEVLVYHLEIEVQDQSGGNVSNALFVSSYNDTGIVSDSGLTDSDGRLTKRLPATEYLFEVYWNDAMVYEDTYQLTDSGTVVLSANIYEVSVTVQDSLEDPLEGAEVTATYTPTEREIDTNSTDENGEVIFQLAEGEHRFDVDWMGIEVASETRVVSESETDFEITASVYQLNIIALDSTEDQEVLSNARVSIRINDDLVDTGNTNSEGAYISKLPATEVKINVEWKGIHVAELNHEIESNENLSINCDVYYLDLTVQDSNDVTVEGVNLDIGHEGGTISSGTSDENGELRVRLPVESYGITGSWHGIDVIDTNYTMIDGQGENSLTLEADIYYLTMNVIDDEGEPLPGTRVEFNVEGSMLFAETTDEAGVVNIRLPSEEYYMTFTWRGFEVADREITVDADVQETVAASVYHVDITTLDSRNITLSDADIYLLHEGTLFEDRNLPEGNTSIRLPHETFRMSVEWNGIKVYNSTQDVNETSEMELNCDVYYLSMTGLDSRGEGVDGLVVSVYHTGLPIEQDLLTTVSLDQEPEVRVPIGEIRVEAEWRGFYVADETVEVTEDSDHSIECEIYYIDVEVVDSEDQYLDGADLVIKDHNGVSFHTETAEMGTAVPRLPIGDWTLDVYWDGKKVGTTETSLEDNEEIKISTDVHYLEITVKGQDEEPIQGVELTLVDSEGKPLFTLQTDENGTAEFEQIVYGDYMLQSRVRKTQLLTNIDLQETDNITLDSSQQLDVTFDEYPRPIYKTNLFYVIALISVIAVLGVIAIAKKKEVL